MAGSAWQCVEIADLLRRIEEVTLDAITSLGSGVQAGIDETTYATFDDSEITALKEKLATIADLGDQLTQLGESLPDERVEVSYDTVRDGAASDLSEGILDPERALLAARVLDVATGWSALARALVDTDVCRAWDGLTVEQMLMRSRGATRTQVRRVIGGAGLALDATFAACSAVKIERLAAALERECG